MKHLVAIAAILGMFMLAISTSLAARWHAEAKQAEDNTDYYKKELESCRHDAVRSDVGWSQLYQDQQYDMEGLRKLVDDMTKKGKVTPKPVSSKTLCSHLVWSYNGSGDVNASFVTPRIGACGTQDCRELSLEPNGQRCLPPSYAH